jgi:mannose-6-phosphate isomerase-like protein (cupin superfamily)
VWLDGNPTLEALVADYTRVNLKEIEDSAAERGPDIEARFGRKHLDSQHLGVSYFKYGPGYRSAMGHSHREQEEAYVVVSGSGRVRLDDEIVELKQWDVVRVAPAVVRGFEGGPDGLEFIAIGSDRPEGGDGVRVDEWWTD